MAGEPDPSQPDAVREAAGKRPPAWLSGDRAIAVLGAGAFLAGSALMISRKGIFIHADTLLLWLMAGLLAISLTQLRRFGLRFLVDWLPIAALFLLYEYSRQISEWLGMATHSALQIRFDEFLFGKPLLTVHLQHLFHQTKAVRLWEYSLLGIYLTHFFLALLVAGLLWRFAYPRFREFRSRLLVLYVFGLLTYILYPADPPWLVSQKLHQLPTIYRTVFEAWGHIGLRAAGAVFAHGNELGNQVAAVPSMHAATSLLICMFFWPRAKPWLRAVLVAYVIGMAFTLVYGGEHYVFDIVVGWLYTGAVMVGVGAFERARERRGERGPSLLTPGLRGA